MDVHLFDQEQKQDVDPLYACTDAEAHDEVFHVRGHVEFKHVPHSDESFMEELRE